MSWLDDPSVIAGGILTGFHGHNDNNNGSAGYTSSEGASAANRANYLTHYIWKPLDSSPANLSPCDTLLNGSLLGHTCVPIVSIFGFDSTTTGWPAAGLAAFTNGSMDALLDTWVALFNALPAGYPILVRLWREMNSTGTIYGANGKANGGVNETPLTYIAAWRYVVGYFRTRCPWVRFCWCPGAGSLIGTPVALHSMAWMSDWYPGDAYVDWIGGDGYVAATAYTPVATILSYWYQAFNPLNGLFAASSGYGTNVCPAPALTPSTTGWSSLSGGSVAADSTDFLYGSGGVQVTTAAGSSGARVALGTGLAAGETYQVTAWLFATGLAVGQTIEIRLRDDTSAQQGSSNTVLVDGWACASMSWTIPAGSGNPHALFFDVLTPGAAGVLSFTVNNLRITKVPAQASGADGVARPPIMVCETQDALADPSRIANTQAYTAALAALTGLSAVSWWDTTTGGTFAIQDSPAGWLAAFQAVVAADPFNGVAPQIGSLPGDYRSMRHRERVRVGTTMQA